MHTAFLCSDYYDPSVPSRQHLLTTRVPAGQQAADRVGDRRDGSHVHCEPFDRVGAQLCPCDIATTTPQAFIVASAPTT